MGASQMPNALGSVKYGMSVIPAYSADVSEVGRSAVNTLNSGASSLSGDHPLVWLLGIGAVTLGLVAFSTHVRVGRANASVSIGD